MVTSRSSGPSRTGAPTPGSRTATSSLQNDPYIGATHQMDTSTYTPLFWEGKLFCWVLNAAHVGDIGGVDSGRLLC